MLVKTVMEMLDDGSVQYGGINLATLMQAAEGDDTLRCAALMNQAGDR